MNKIPNKYKVGGQSITVSTVDSLPNDILGDSNIGSGLVRIAKTFRGLTQSEDSKFNTFIHELTHTVLDTIGRADLSDDETFVCSFASILTEAINSMEYDS